MSTSTGGANAATPLPGSASANDPAPSERARARITALVPRHPPRGVKRMAPGYPRSTPREHTRSWRDAIQSFAHETAEMPVISRLLAGQGVLLLGFASVYGALAMRRRLRGAPIAYPEEIRSHGRTSQRAQPLLAGATAVMGLVFVGAALAFVARTRALPAVTVLFTYGRALRQYVRPLRRSARAA